MVVKWTRTKPEPLKYFEQELNLNPNRYLKRFDTPVQCNLLGLSSEATCFAKCIRSSAQLDEPQAKRFLQFLFCYSRQRAFQHILLRFLLCWQTERQREVKFSVKLKCHCTCWVTQKSVTSLQAHLCAILLIKATLLEKCSNKDERLPQMSPIRPTLDFSNLPLSKQQVQTY